MNDFGIFPTLYPDELVYSLFARYHIKSGNLFFRDTARELFGSELANTETEFLTALTPMAQKVMTKDTDLEAVILGHTMFKQYARFLKKEQRKKAMDNMLAMKGGYAYTLSLPKKEEGSEYLRYCPQCAREDRENYGETYWHTIHQFRGIRLCPIHHCRLYDSSVNMNKRKSLGLYCAEHEAVLETVQPGDSPREAQLADYVYDVYRLPLAMENDAESSDYLCSKLEGTRYLSARGEQKRMSLLTEDFLSYYKELPPNEALVKERWRIEKLFTGYQRDLLGICQMAMFLGADPKELETMALPPKSQKELFDETVRTFSEQGLGYRGIAKRMGVSAESVRIVFKKKEEGSERKRKGTGRKQKDWNKLDEELLPEVTKAVERLYGVGEDRPRRIQVATVQNCLGLPTKCFDKLPLCRSVIQSKQETREEYWAREIVWAMEETQRQNRPLCWRRIRDLTNLKKEQFQRSLPLIENEEYRIRLEGLI